MNPPMAVETAVDTVDRSGFGKATLGSPSSSSLTGENCFGSCCSARPWWRASSAENPLSW